MHQKVKSYNETHTVTSNCLPICYFCGTWEYFRPIRPEEYLKLEVLRDLLSLELRIGLEGKMKTDETEWKTEVPEKIEQMKTRLQWLVENDGIGDVDRVMKMSSDLEMRLEVVGFVGKNK